MEERKFNYFIIILVIISWYISFFLDVYVVVFCDGVKYEATLARIEAKADLPLAVAPRWQKMVPSKSTEITR